MSEGMDVVALTFSSVSSFPLPRQNMAVTLSAAGRVRRTHACPRGDYASSTLAVMDGFDEFCDRSSQVYMFCVSSGCTCVHQPPSNITRQIRDGKGFMYTAWDERHNASVFHCEFPFLEFRPREKKPALKKALNLVESFKLSGWLYRG